MPVIEAEKNLVAELRSARAESDKLFTILKPDALYERPIAERHRVIFYVGHLDAFDCILICREALGIKSRDSELDTLFRAGIDPDSNHLPSDKQSDWPSIENVRAYVKRCRAEVDDNLERAPEDVIHMALEHREMHLETLAYMFHNFEYNRKRTPNAMDQEDIPPSEWTNEWRDVPAGRVVLGKPHDSSFGWDNEYDELRTAVDGFRIQRYSVTNREYLRFVDEGAPIPNFWIRRGDLIYYRGMFEETPLPLDWPVYVTQEEAETYAKWMGKSLPTEEQFHRAAYGTLGGGEREYPWGTSEPAHNRGNFDFQSWDPQAVYATPEGDSAFGVSQLTGNGWEWTRTQFAPFPGFKPHPSYPGYSANFFDGEHYVLKGGSARTAVRLLRRSFRNWFRRDYPYMYAKFRCVEN
ncbi:MAG: SUMF1/EgtB/PvdO family nonheme iron enzyme [Acidobacteriaceae bacterium]|nr:SUMF1/EgtB/PvdO family nonheme iron enzyme [Acidobacteriaceae bacterium]